jgi:uncharacterized protein YgbK (DUF1537 family)
MKGDNTLSIIADDFTGAVDTAVFFFKEGFRTSFNLFPDKNDLSVVKVMNTDSRNREDRTFIDIVTSRLEDIRKSKWKFKKIDSTLRGQIGREIEVLINLLDLETALVVPSYPQAGRIVQNGVIYLHGCPVHLTNIAEDFASPITHSNVHQMIACQTELPIGVISCDILLQGEDKTKQEILAMEAEGIKIICFDAIEDAHLEHIFKTGVQLDPEGKRFLWVGSAGLAKSVCRFMSAENQSRYSSSTDQARFHFHSGQMMIVNGSKKNLSDDQLQKLSNIVTFDQVVIHDHEDVHKQDIHSYSNISVITSPKADNSSLPCPTISEAIAELVKLINEHREISSMIMIGGDTAWKIINLIATEKVEIIGEIEPAVPYGILHLKDDKKIMFVSKGGSIGNVDTLVNVYNYIQKMIER